MSTNIVLKFFAEWCAPCKQLTQLIASLPYVVEVRPIDIDKNPEEALKYGVRGLPTLVVVDKETLNRVSNIKTPILVGSSSIMKAQLEEFLKGANVVLNE